jgi:hypothetical protein
MKDHEVSKSQDSQTPSRDEERRFKRRDFLALTAKTAAGALTVGAFLMNGAREVYADCCLDPKNGHTCAGQYGNGCYKDVTANQCANGKQNTCSGSSSNQCTAPESKNGCTGQTVNTCTGSGNANTCAPGVIWGGTNDCEKGGNTCTGGSDSNRCTGYQAKFTCLTKNVCKGAGSNTCRDGAIFSCPAATGDSGNSCADSAPNNCSGSGTQNNILPA